MPVSNNVEFRPDEIMECYRSINKLLHDAITLREENRKLKEENEKLKEENEQLKKEKE